MTTAMDHRLKNNETEIYKNNVYEKHLKLQIELEVDEAATT